MELESRFLWKVFSSPLFKKNLNAVRCHPYDAMLGDADAREEMQDEFGENWEEEW